MPVSAQHTIDLLQDLTAANIYSHSCSLGRQPSRELSHYSTIILSVSGSAVSSRLEMLMIGEKKGVNGIKFSPKGILDGLVKKQ